MGENGGGGARGGRGRDRCSCARERGARPGPSRRGASGPARTGSNRGRERVCSSLPAGPVRRRRPKPPPPSSGNREGDGGPLPLPHYPGNREGTGGGGGGPHPFPRETVGFWVVLLPQPQRGRGGVRPTPSPKELLFLLSQGRCRPGRCHHSSGDRVRQRKRPPGRWLRAAGAGWERPGSRGRVLGSWEE